MNAIAEVLLLLSTASLGIFAGAMLTEGFVLVAFWRSLPPAGFLDWYAANDRRLLAFFSPLTIVTVLLAVSAAVVAWFVDGASSGLAAIAALLAAIALATFFLYFERANKSFATAGIEVNEVAAELARWATWHWVRTAISVAAFASSLLALR